MQDQCPTNINTLAPKIGALQICPEKENIDFLQNGYISVN
jgi:hypothetical protein